MSTAHRLPEVGLVFLQDLSSAALHPHEANAWRPPCQPVAVLPKRPNKQWARKVFTCRSLHRHLVDACSKTAETFIRPGETLPWGNCLLIFEGRAQDCKSNAVTISIELYSHCPVRRNGSALGQAPRLIAGPQSYPCFLVLASDFSKGPVDTSFPPLLRMSPIQSYLNTWASCERLGDFLCPWRQSLTKSPLPPVDVGRFLVNP